MTLDRASILSANDLKTIDVEVPEWGGSVRVRALTGTARDMLGRSLVGADGKPDPTHYNIKLVALSLVGENGHPLFTLDDVQALGDKAAPVIDRLASEIEKLNHLGSDAVEAARGN